MYRCPQSGCNFQFAQWGQVRSHIKKESHGGGDDSTKTYYWKKRCFIPGSALKQTPQQPEQIEFRCQYCRSRWPSWHSFAAHVRDKQHGNGSNWTDVSGLGALCKRATMINWSKTSAAVTGIPAPRTPEPKEPEGDKFQCCECGAACHAWLCGAAGTKFRYHSSGTNFVKK